MKLFLLWITINILLWFAPELWESGKRAVSCWRIERKASRYEARAFAIPGQANVALPCLVFRPELKANQKAPLIIVLHGSGERGNDGRTQLRTVGTFLVERSFQSPHPCFVIAPQCPENLNWRSSRPIDVQGAVVGMIDELVETERVDVSRIYLIGYSMGAYGCWRYLADMPDRFAGCIAVAGGGDSVAADAIASTPVWAIHGESDDVVPPEQSQEMVDAVIAAGGNARLTILGNAGHGSFQVVKQTPNDYLEWLFQQQKSRGPSDDQD